MKKIPLYILVLIIFGFALTGMRNIQPQDNSRTENVWVMPILKQDKISYPCPVVIWFSEQFLADSHSYQKRAKEFADWKRSELRQQVVSDLKYLNNASWHKAESAIARLRQKNQISGIKRHWIINGFSCMVNSPDGLKALNTIPGVKKIFAKVDKRTVSAAASEIRFYEPVRETKFNHLNYNHPWYIQQLQADRVWQEFGFTGKGIINIIHDNNFVFSKNLIPNLYRNPGEIPNNGRDDDHNGYVDDYHGYNFDKRNTALTLSAIPKDSPKSGPALHGFRCAAIICGIGRNRAGKSSWSRYRPGL